MKIARFFAAVFATIGTALMLGTLILCLFSLNSPAKLREVPQEAQICAQEMVNALAAGDLASAAANMYGQPDLGVHGRIEEEAGQLVWSAFLDSMSCEFTGEYYVRDGLICRDAAITVMDIPRVTEQWNGWVHTFLTAEVQAAEDRGELMELYDENNNFRTDLVDKVIREAVEESLKEDLTTTCNVTLKLIYRDDAWWVAPDEALLQTIAGGV